MLFRSHRHYLCSRGKPGERRRTFAVDHPTPEMKTGACFGRLQVFIIVSQLGLSIEKGNRLRLPQWFILYLLLVPLAGTSFPARCGSYLGDHIAPAPPAQWCVYQYRTPHSCHWSHSDTLYLLRYTVSCSHRYRNSSK